MVRFAEEEIPPSREHGQRSRRMSSNITARLARLAVAVAVPAAIAAASFGFATTTTTAAAAAQTVASQATTTAIHHDQPGPGDNPWP